MFKILILVASIAFLGEIAGQEISDKCLGCICQASTGCNKNQGKNKFYTNWVLLKTIYVLQGCSDAGVCGAFLLTWGYFI
jgi:hypothetical protein